MVLVQEIGIHHDKVMPFMNKHRTTYYNTMEQHKDLKETESEYADNYNKLINIARQ
jgi:hypothetical protein